MPQLDLSTYIAQIFWFFLCFISLYLASHFLILPRIAAILKERKNIIDSDQVLANDLDKKISNLRDKTEKLRQNANHRYQNQIEEVVKNSVKNREASILQLKEKIEEASKKSRLEIRNFIQNSHKQSDQQIDVLSKLIKEKILN